MAIGEALTNIAAAYIENLENVKLSANWMVAANYEGEDAALFDTVKAVGMELCPKLGIAIPVGKDSVSMRTNWKEDGRCLIFLLPFVFFHPFLFQPKSDVSSSPLLLCHRKGQISDCSPFLDCFSLFTSR